MNNIKRTTLTGLIIGASLLMLFSRPAGAEAWSGTDVTVIENAAARAGRKPSDPLINTDQGDLLLFVFLLAGTAGGFVGGYYYHKLFCEPDNAS